MEISIDAHRCTGHARCYEVSSELFDVDNDERGTVLQPVVPAALEEAAREAARSCPESAVVVED